MINMNSFLVRKYYLYLSVKYKNKINLYISLRKAFKKEIKTIEDEGEKQGKGSKRL